MNESTLQKYHYGSAASPHTAAYLYAPVMAALRRLKARRVLDLGCGNGAFCGALAANGFEVIGCDPSSDGLRFARTSFPAISFHQLGVADDPAALGGPFDAVVSMEVIEHLYAPRELPLFAAKVLRPGGHLIITTPYHGYAKNLALAVTGKLDGHFTALWDGGHIKFFSRSTLVRLLAESGFESQEFIGAGRWPYLWKSMVLVAKMPAQVKKL